MIVMIVNIEATSKRPRIWNALLLDDVLQRWCLRTFAFDVPRHWTRIA